MKEIRIKISSVLRELAIWLLMLILAFFTNVYAIMIHDGQWGELVSQLHIVFLLSIFYYIVLVIIRLIILGVYRLVKRYVSA